MKNNSLEFHREYKKIGCREAVLENIILENYDEMKPNFSGSSANLYALGDNRIIKIFHHGSLVCPSLIEKLVLLQSSVKKTNFSLGHVYSDGDIIGTNQFYYRGYPTMQNVRVNDIRLLYIFRNMLTQMDELCQNSIYNADLCDKNIILHPTYFNAKTVDWDDSSLVGQIKEQKEKMLYNLCITFLERIYPEYPIEKNWKGIPIMGESFHNFIKYNQIPSIIEKMLISKDFSISILDQYAKSVLIKKKRSIQLAVNR